MPVQEGNHILYIFYQPNNLTPSKAESNTEEDSLFLKLLSLPCREENKINFQASRYDCFRVRKGKLILSHLPCSCYSPPSKYHVAAELVLRCLITFDHLWNIRFQPVKEGLHICSCSPNPTWLSRGKRRETLLPLPEDLLIFLSSSSCGSFHFSRGCRRLPPWLKQTPS